MTPDWQAIVLERIATHAPIEQTFDMLVSLVEAQITGAIGSLLLLDAGGKTLRSASTRGLPSAYNLAIEGVSIGPKVGSCGTAAFLGEPVIASDIENDDRWADFRELARQHGLRACWSIPLVSRRQPDQRSVLGTFAVYFRSPAVPEARDHEVLASAASLGCIAIEAEQTVAALRESETRFRTFVDHASDAFFLHDASDSRVIDVNRQACLSLGYTREELIGAQPSLFDRNAESLCQSLIASLQTGGCLTFESRHWRKDETSFPVEIRIGNFTAGGRMLNLALVRDISLRVELEDRLRQSQKLEAIGRLAGGVAHDFNNLLTVINAQTELLLESCAKDDPMRAELAVVRDAGERGAALTAQLLAFGRRTLAAPKPIDLAMLVNRLAQMFKRILGEQIVLRTDIRSQRSIVLADDGLIEQVLMNLVLNARDAMPNGGQIVISTSRVEVLGHEQIGAKNTSRTHLSLAVTDTGEGMSEEVKARMFEPFFTTKPPGKGSGLGLATVYGIVAQAGGQIRVDSQLHRGTKIEILLPALDGPEAQALESSARASQDSAVVLLAEDEDGVRRVVSRVLEHYHYTVLAARDAADALAMEQAHSGTIDVLLTDLVMPGTGGRALAELIRARRPAIKVVYMSGYTDDQEVREGVTAGSEAFIQKPFAPQALVGKLRSVLAAEDGSADAPL